MIDAAIRVSALESFASHMQIIADNRGNLADSNYRTLSHISRLSPADRSIEYTAPYGTYNRDVPPPPEMPLAHDKNVNWEYMENDAHSASVPQNVERLVLDMQGNMADAADMALFESTSGAIINLSA